VQKLGKPNEIVKQRDIFAEIFGRIKSFSLLI